MQHPDVCIAGAGVIGLSLALELTRHGAHVTVLDRGPALAEASTAAAGMLAANDPHNPPQLQPLADLSIDLYPAFLHHLANLSDLHVPFQTELTLQATTSPSSTSASAEDLHALLPSHNLSRLPLTLLDEHSLDPRQLAHALLIAARNTTIDLREHTAIEAVNATTTGVTIRTDTTSITCSHFVDCTGAWSATLPGAVTPWKGQMLSVKLPATFPLSIVLRTEHLYIVPRTSGPQAGRAIIGATVESVGFDKLLHPEDLTRLRAEAIKFLPALAEAPVLEQWAGLRPGTTDQLPLLGPDPANPRHLFATGHFRNGILLAPATAHLLTGLILRQPPALDLQPFAPGRFARTPLPEKP